MRLASLMVQQPHQSLPKQCGNWADLKAAYRLLSHPQVQPRHLTEPHCRQTRQACAGHNVVLAVQDDTKHAGRCGRMIHSTLAVLPEGQLLGMLDQRCWQRVERDQGETPHEREQRWRESMVWADAVKRVGPAPPGCRLIHVGDQASDDLKTIEACRAQDVGVVLRAQHDRRIDQGKLWPHLRSQQEVTHQTAQIGTQGNKRGRIVRRQREAQVSVRWAKVQLQSPWNHPGAHPPQWVWAVYVWEEDPPAGVEAVEWMLLTSEPVEHAKDAKRIVGYYQRRWVIEEWHRALKEGCRLEDAQLDQPEDHQRLAAILSVVAVRLLQLRDLARPEHPQAQDAQALRRWMPGVWIEVVAHLAEESAQTLTPRTFFLTLARRGGYLDREHDPPPGWKVIWRGWYDVARIVQGVELARQGLDPPTYG